MADYDDTNKGAAIIGGITGFQRGVKRLVIRQVKQHDAILNRFCDRRRRFSGANIEFSRKFYAPQRRPITQTSPPKSFRENS